MRADARWGIDTLVGVVPVLGDAFDIFWRSNRRNMKLLRDHFEVDGGPSAHEVATLLIHVTDGITYSWLRTRDSAASRRMIDAAVPALAAAVTGRG